MLSLFQIYALVLLAAAAPLPALENTDFLIPGTMITTTEEAANDPAVIKFWQDRVAAQDAQKHAENGAQAQAASAEKWRQFTAADKHSLPSTDHLIPGTSITGTAQQAAHPELWQHIEQSETVSGDGIETAAKAAPGFLEKAKSALSKLRFW